MTDIPKPVLIKAQKRTGELSSSIPKVQSSNNKRKNLKNKELRNNPFDQFSPIKKVVKKSPTKKDGANLRYLNQCICSQMMKSVGDFSQYGINKSIPITKNKKEKSTVFISKKAKIGLNNNNTTTKPKECFYKRLLNVKQSVFIDQKQNEKPKNANSSHQTKRMHSSTPGVRNHSTPHCHKVQKKNNCFDIIVNSKLRTLKSPMIKNLKTPKFKEKIHTHSKERKIKQQITISFIKPKKEIKNTYCILPNNNGKLVERCMQTRTKWESVDKSQSSTANLYWTPLAYKIVFYKNENICQYVNHIENHSELSNKMKLFANLIKHCEFTKQNLFSFYPFTIIFQLSHSSFTEQFNNFKKLYGDISQFIVTDNSNATTISSNYINYFNVNLSKKTGAEQKILIPKTHYTGRNLWLIKPINLNRGRCIKILNNIDEISTELNNLKENKIFCDEKKKKISSAEFILIQKYIERPLLYKNRKFDIRMWVLFTDLDDIYVFKEGHLKATCDKYDINSLNPYIHLTNYSVQKHNLNFSKTEQGNEISFEEFQNELNATTKPIKNFRKEIYPKICNIIKITENATRSKINSFVNKNSFEIFGYDFLIDCEFNPFLIEINTNPGYEESSPLIKMLVPRMIDDALRLTVDTSFPRDPSMDKYVDISPFEVKGYSNKENMWQKLNK